MDMGSETASGRRRQLEKLYESVYFSAECRKMLCSWEFRRRLNILLLLSPLVSTAATSDLPRVKPRL